MHNWQANEVRELLTLRGSDQIRNNITGTVKDSVVYQNLTRLLAERGVFRSHMQVVSKLKALKKQYCKVHQQKTRSGSPHVNWQFYELCNRVWDPAYRDLCPSPPSPSTPSPPAAPPSPLPPPLTPPPLPAAPMIKVKTDEHQEVVVGLWDDVDVKDIKDIHKQLGPVEQEDEEEQYSPPEPLQASNAAYTVPPKRRKTTVMEQVSTLVSATVSQLKEMDATMQAQEDARLQRLMDHEKEMQNSLMSQLIAMHDRISRESHDRHVQLVDRILAHFPSTSGPSKH